MGQYYTLITVDLKRKNYHRYTPTNGFKLMEFAYYNDSMASLFCSEVYNDPKRVVVLGDYAEPSDFRDPELPSVLDLNMLNKLPEEKKIEQFDFNNKYVVNSSRAQYIKLSNPSKNECKIFEPLILCALGNGKGGGDYYGINNDLVGLWAGQIIQVVDEELFQSAYSDFEPLEVSFEEV